VIELKKIWERKESADKVFRRAFRGSPVFFLLPIEVDILSYISAEPGATIQKILMHDYFGRVSLSTIKRAVVKLIDKGFIHSKINPKDRRERHLEVTI
jgi:DNA-binding MarR family transcriptional regulator